MPDVNDIPDNVLLGRVIGHIAKRGRRREKAELWVIIQEHFALGATYSAQLCRRYGFEPSQLVRR